MQPTKVKLEDRVLFEVCRVYRDGRIEHVSFHNTVRGRHTSAMREWQKSKRGEFGIAIYESDGTTRGRLIPFKERRHGKLRKVQAEAMPKGVELPDNDTLHPSPQVLANWRKGW